MSKVAAIPIRPANSDRHAPVLSTLDPSFSPASLHLQPWTSPSALPSTSPSQGYSPSSSPSPPPLGHSPRPAFAVPMGSRCEKVPYDGPGTAVYVRQPTRAQLRDNNSLFGSSSRPYYFQDPQNKPFINIDGKECGIRWIYVDPKARAQSSEDGREDKAGCCVM